MVLHGRGLLLPFFFTIVLFPFFPERQLSQSERQKKNSRKYQQVRIDGDSETGGTSGIASTLTMQPSSSKHLLITLMSVYTNVFVLISL